ncbi:MAG TPA: ABC transporter permease subunit [Vicinamibacterales bacterium]|nr:ABC transporter permease subunit [Vicinamibacterales bacterium]
MSAGKTSRPSLFYSAMRVFDLSLGEMLWSRRTVFMGLVVGLPVLISLIVRVLHDLGAPNMRINNATTSGPVIFGLMMWAFFVRFSVPVLGVFYGTALIADEVDDKTITYLFTRPIARSAVVLGKYFAYLACTVLVVLPSVVLVWLLVVPLNGSLGASFPDLLTDLGLLALGLAVYGAVFAFIGTAIKRPLLVGLLFVFGWETGVMALPGYLKRFSVAYYLQGLVPHAMPSDSAISIISSIFRETPTLTDSLISLALITVASLWLAGSVVSKREYILEQ